MYSSHELFCTRAKSRLNVRQPNH